MKTSTYTFKLPIEIGGILGGASPEEIENLLGFAEPVGIGFQIRDDILGVFGNDKETGKESISDIMEGKKTLLILKAMENADQADREIIEKGLGNENITNEEAAKIREIIKNTNSLKYSEEKISEYIEKAKNSLSFFINKKYNQKAVNFLSDIADYMCIRNT